MKQTLKKTLALLLVLVQVFVLLPFGMTTAKAEENDPQVPELNPIISGTVQFGSFNYLSSRGTYEAADYVMPFIYTDDYFAAPSYSSAVTSAVASRGRTLNWTDLEDESLATASMNFTMASFGSNEEITDVNDYKTDYDKNGKKFLQDCGFTAVASNNMGGDNVFNQLPSQDSVGVIFGVKQIKVWNAETKQNETCKLVAIGVRGAGYGAEWASNLTLGESGVHKGFRDSADKVEKALDAFLTAQGVTAKDAKFWVVGYSRAGAIANLVAGDLDTKYSVPKEQVYAYTFESAAGATMTKSGTEPVDAATKTTNYPNIHNIINVMDAVPRVSTALFQNNRLGVDYRVPFYGNTSGTLNSDYYKRMYSILPTVAQGYYNKDDDGNPVWGNDPAVTNARPNTAGGTYPVNGQILVHKFDILAAITDGTNYPMGAKPYDDWKGTLIPNASGTKGNYYIALDTYLNQLVYEAFHSRAWDYDGSKLFGKWELADTKWTYEYGVNPITNTATTTDASQHRKNYVKLGNYNMKHNYDEQNADEVSGWSKMTYQNAFRYLVGKVLGKPGARLTDVIGSLTNDLWDLITEGGGFYLSITGVGGYDSGTNENRASIVDSHMRALLMDFLDDSATFKDPNYIYRYRVCGDTKAGWFDNENNEYDTFTISQDTAEAIGALSPVLTRLFLYDRATYGSQYLGTLLKYGLDTILVTHTPELDVSWQMAMDENYTSDYREITLPKATSITMNVFREGFEGEMDADVAQAASADGAVIANVTDGNISNCKDNRITMRLDPTNSSNIIIRYPGTMDYRFDVKPLSETTDLNVTLKDLAPVSGTNVKATYNRNGTTGNIEGVPAREYNTMLVQDGSTNTADATEINTYSDGNNIAMKPNQTMHILAWHGSNSLDTGASKEAEYAIQMTTPKTQLVDFGTVTIAENAGLGKVYQANNGEFKASDSGNDVVYQLNAIQNGTGAAFENVDSANADYNADASKGRKQVYLTDHVSVVPASSVYYDDDLNGQSFTSDGHGYSAKIDDAAVSKVTSDSTDPLYFTFYGTGIEAYCTTHGSGGYVQAALYETDSIDGCVAANLVSITENGKRANPITVKNHSADILYNTPTISFTGLPQKTYTLRVYPLSGVQYKFDGVRVYDAVMAGSAAATAQEDAGEGNVLYVNLHEQLVNTGTDVTVAKPAGMANPVDLESISGILFVDNAENLSTESHWYKDEGATEDSWHAAPQKVYTTQFDAYKNNSPKNEIYLNKQTTAEKDDGSTEVKTQAITFQVNASKLSDNSEIYIGLSAPELDKTARNPKQAPCVTINNVPLDPQVNSVMDMYYKVNYSQSEIANGKLSITVKNEGNTLISITNLKITNVPEAKGILGMPANDKKTAMRAFFLPVTTETVELAAAEPETVVTEPVDPAVPEEPVIPAETPAPTPDPTPAPTPVPTPTPTPTSTSAANAIFLMFSDFVFGLFRGFGRLFGH